MPSGTVDNPMSDRAIENKFLANAAPAVGDERARQIAATAWKLDKLGDVRDAHRSLRLMRGAGSASMPADKQSRGNALKGRKSAMTSCRCCKRCRA